MVTNQPGKSVEENVRAQSEPQKQICDLIFLDHKDDLHYLRSAVDVLFNPFDALYRTSRFSRYEAEGATSVQFTVASPQHFLYFFPEPQGHGSFRPTLGVLRRCSDVRTRAQLADATGNTGKPPTAQPPCAR
jgi:hypothetical protein